MNRKTKFISVLLFIIMATTACAKSTLSEMPVSTSTPFPEAETQDSSANDPYQYSESAFQQSYQSALESISSGEFPATEAPTDPQNSGFSVVCLDKDIYGTDALAILPILQRELTEEELLQLAFAMKGASFEEMLSPSRSYLIGKEGQRLQNRSFYWEERIRNYQLNSAYCFEGARPKKFLSNSPEDGDSLLFKIPRLKEAFPDTYRLYPSAEMTDGR